MPLCKIILDIRNIYLCLMLGLKARKRVLPFPRFDVVYRLFAGDYWWCFGKYRENPAILLFETP